MDNRSEAEIGIGKFFESQRSDFQAKMKTNIDSNFGPVFEDWESGTRGVTQREKIIRLFLDI